MSPFLWRDQPSEIVNALKPSTLTRKANLAPKRLHHLSNKADEILRARFGGAYSKAAHQEKPDAL